MMSRTLCHLSSVLSLLVIATAVPADQVDVARQIIDDAGVTGGLIVHVGCGSGDLTAALKLGPQFLVHGVDTDQAAIDTARRDISSDGAYGDIAVDLWDGRRLPYGDNMVNLVVTERATKAVTREAMRVLAPLGVMMTRKGDAWGKQVKEWPDDIDEWSHYLHGPDNNAVAHDQRVAPPRSLQWTGSPRWARHHDRLSSTTALVSAGGRIFYIFDEGPGESIMVPSEWAVIARDAFNGVVLWKREIADWQTRLWPLKSGPAQLPRRLVATGDTVFTTLGIDVPVTALDAETGETARVYEGTEGTEEILHSDGDLFLVVDPEVDTEKYTDHRNVNQPWWTGKVTSVVAVRADSGEILWEHEASVVPLTLTVDAERVVFHNGQQVVCLDRTDGSVMWESEPVEIVEGLMSFFAPTMVLQEGVVLFAGGEESGLVKSSGGATKNDTLTAIDGDSGDVLWTAEHPPSGYSSPEDLFVIDGTVWLTGVASGGLPGEVKGLDLHTGEVKVSYAKADADTYWFHHRCYRGKATDRFLMVSRTGTEFIDPTTGHWDINHWTRGACLYGLMPANGLTYTPPNSCACYPESRLSGFNALTAALPEGLKKTPKGSRLQRGPAYGDVSTPTDAPSGDWPTYRHDARRSGGTPEALAPALAQSWETSLGGGLSAVTVADGKVFVADVDAHAVHALDAASGELSWTFVAGGRVDSPPTIHGNTALFGCADGSAYCVRASDGVLVWRFRLAPIDSRIIAREQLESRWPVPGSVLVHEGEVYAVAGRSLFLDGGIRFCKLDAATGALITESILDDRDPETGEDVQSRISRLTMPVALPDVLSTDGAHVYMRSQVFDMDGTRADLAIEATQRGTHAAIQEGDTAHLFSDAGFLDGTYYHRSYWLYGRNFEGGWNSYYLAGQNVPAGKILSYNEESVFGFGRQPKYYKWTVPMEFHLFSAPLRQGADEPRDEFLSRGTIIRVEKSASLNPAGKPLAAMAWARPQQPDGVILARGGNSLGYALYLKDGIPRFALRANGEGTEVAATEPITDAWAHVTGVLTPDAELRIYINGELAGTKAAPGLLPNDPAEALQIGGDESSKVGEYGDSLGFRGIIDEVRVYHGDLPEAAIQGFAGVAEEAGTGDAALALYLSFNKENASDTSGNKNNGTIVGAESARGQAGAGMRFSGRMPNGTASGVIHTWSEKVPLLARGLVLAGDTLFVAGPDDLLDEPAALAAPESPETQEKIAAQSAALAGESGGVLRAVASGDGTLLSEMRLDTIPVWDGMAATNGSLYIAGIDGTVRCLSAE